MSSAEKSDIATDSYSFLSSLKRIFMGVLVALLFALPLGLIFVFALPMASVFDEDLPELLRAKCIRFILVVGCFIAAAFVSNSRRFSFNRVGIFTAGFLLLFLVHLSFTIWGATSSQMIRRFGAGASTMQYLWMLGSMFYGMITWSFIRRGERCRTESSKATKSQFTIGSILVWITLTGLMISLLKTWSFAFDSYLFRDPNASIDVVVCAVLCFVLLFPLTMWLMRTRQFLLVSLGCWIICFAASWFLFAMIGLSDSGYDWRDGYVSTIAAFSIASAAYLYWMQAMRLFLGTQTVAANRENTRPRLITRLATGVFAIVSIALWGFVGFWAITNLASFSKERSFAAFDSSPLIMQQLEDAYGAETMARVREKHDPQKLHEWLNHLSRDRVPQENDINYQIGKLTKLEFIDRPEGEGLYRKLMGFTAAEVALLPDETIDTWVKANRVEPRGKEHVFYEGSVSTYLADMPNDSYGWQLPYAPWDRTSMPLADKFCREKQPLIRRIRNFIKSCDEGTFPVFEHGIFTSDDIPRFAADMLFVDTTQAIDQEELPRVFDNLGCISKLAKMRHPISGWSFLSHRLRARSMDVLSHVAEVKNIGEAEIARVRQLALDLNSPIHESEINKARYFACCMLEHRSNMDSKRGGNYLLLERELESRLIAVFPQTVHWSSYIETYRDRFDYYFELRSEIVEAPDRLAGIYQIATAEADLKQRFHCHLMNLLETPQTRSRRLGVMDYSYDLHRLKLLVVYSIRAKLRRVALELLLHRIEQGSFPKSLEELNCNVGDPFSNQSFVYRIIGDRFELYSVGEDKVDDGGRYYTDDIFFDWPARTLAEYFENN